MSFDSDGQAANAPLTDLHPRDEFFGNHGRANVGGLDKPATGIEHIEVGKGPVTPSTSPRPALGERVVVPGCPAITGGWSER